MKMRTFYKKLPLFIKNCPLLFIKKSMLQIVIYKKLNFWEEYTPLAEKTWRVLGPDCKLRLPFQIRLAYDMGSNNILEAKYELKTALHMLLHKIIENI